MMLCESLLRDRIQPWLRDYDRLQSFAVILIYIQVQVYYYYYFTNIYFHSDLGLLGICISFILIIALASAQIGCALIGSLGALYNGVLLINLAISLFALVAIESSSQSLGRTYAVLLVSAIFLDISWFILFTHDIWCALSSSTSTSTSTTAIIIFYFSFTYSLTLLLVLANSNSNSNACTIRETMNYLIPYPPTFFLVFCHFRLHFSLLTIYNSSSAIKGFRVTSFF